MKTIFTLVVLGTLLTLSACGKNDSSGAASPLEGTWSNGCRVLQGNGADSSMLVALTITGSTAAQRIDNFDSKDCTGDNAGRIEAKLSFTLSGNKIDSKTVGTTIVANTAGRVEGANGRGDCGFNDWQKGQAKTVSGRDCSQSGLPASFTAKEGTAAFDIYEIKKDGNDQKLCFGNRSGTTEAERPTELDTNDCLKKVAQGPAAPRGGLGL